MKHLARTFNLTYSAFGIQISEEGAPASGTLTLSEAFQIGFEPAPITPTGVDAAPYQLLSGTIKATYNAHRSINDTDSVIVAPGLMTGNTDTRFYWKLSRHIFRYNHDNIDEKNPRSGIHGVNECTFNRPFSQRCSPDILIFQIPLSILSWKRLGSSTHSSSMSMRQNFFEGIDGGFSGIYITILFSGSIFRGHFMNSVDIERFVDSRKRHHESFPQVSLASYTNWERESIQ